MAVTTEGLGSIDANRADGAVRPEELGTTPTDSSTVEDQEQEEQRQAPGPSPDTDATPAPGPVPYERFYEVNEARKALEATLQSLGPIQDVYRELSSNPAMAQAFAQAIQAARGTIQQTAQALPPIDESLMTDTERGLYRQNQALATRLNQVESGMQQAVSTSFEAATQTEMRNVDAAMSSLESWAKEKGYPFDPQKIIDQMDKIPIEAYVAGGASVEDLAMTAYRDVYFDELATTIRTQTYAEQRGKAKSSLASPASRSGGVPAVPKGMHALTDRYWKENGLPEF